MVRRFPSTATHVDRRATDSVAGAFGLSREAADTAIILITAIISYTLIVRSLNRLCLQEDQIALEVHG
ncbi:MAG TPA: hypothetical protein VEL31_10290 [Ktedonobacteraceae bacterium]|nr:hypothetical protein [Ktedonobacteraceae bacterium]